jgi:3-dehydroquinate synthase
MILSTLSYPIYLKESLYEQYVNILKNIPNKYSDVYIIVDENTHLHCLPVFLQKVPLSNYQPIIIPGGENNKSLLICTHIWENLTKKNADRSVLLINLGGGLVTDLGGFAASVYKRGVDFLNIPTTLLAQVDASVGSKTGVNFLGYKNQIGAFSDPTMVLVDTDYLKTLNKRNLNNGFAEIWKHALIKDKNYWHSLVNEELSLEEIIQHSIEIKKKVVEQDSKEQGLRKILNFGHSFAHAIESFAHQSNIDILHGEAVVIGMIAESYLSLSYGLTKDECEEIVSFLRDKVSKDLAKSVLKDDILPFILQDKKNVNNKLMFTLLSSIGSSVYNIEISEEEVKLALNFTKNQFA